MPHITNDQIAAMIHGLEKKMEKDTRSTRLFINDVLKAQQEARKPEPKFPDYDMHLSAYDDGIDPPNTFTDLITGETRISQVMSTEAAVRAIGGIDGRGFIQMLTLGKLSDAMGYRDARRMRYGNVHTDTHAYLHSGWNRVLRGREGLPLYEARDSATNN